MKKKNNYALPLIDEGYNWVDKENLEERPELPLKNKVTANDLNYLKLTDDTQQNQISGLDNRITKNSSDITEIEANIDNIKTKNSDQDKRMDEIEANMGNSGNDLRLYETIVAHNNDIDKLEPRIVFNTQTNRRGLIKSTNGSIGLSLLENFDFKIVSDTATRAQTKNEEQDKKLNSLYKEQIAQESKVYNNNQQFNQLIFGQIKVNTGDTLKISFVTNTDSIILNTEIGDAIYNIVPFNIGSRIIKPTTGASTNDNAVPYYIELQKTDSGLGFVIYGPNGRAYASKGITINIYHYN